MRRCSQCEKGKYQEDLPASDRSVRCLEGGRSSGVCKTIVALLRWSAIRNANWGDLRESTRANPFAKTLKKKIYIYIYT